MSYNWSRRRGDLLLIVEVMGSLGEMIPSQLCGKVIHKELA
jgi:hypothetical protein